MSKAGTVLNGMRPTSKLHLGNYLGSVVNMVELQEEYNCYFTIVDWHALTTGYEDTALLQENILSIAMDWLSSGVDPKRSVMFVQSHVKEHAELHLLLSMITPLGWLERVPTYKEQLRELEGKNIHTYGFLGYPLLQAADILAYRADTVPVGEDQLPHLELSREVARRFNHLYEEIFPEPQARLTQVPLLPGTDGRKMSKSYGNDISLSAGPEEIEPKIRQMVTDPEKIRKNDPGRPEVCTVAAFYKVFWPQKVDEVFEECREGAIGCVDCKKRLAQRIAEDMQPVYEARRELEKDEDYVWDVLRDGADRARSVAAETLDRVRAAMNVRPPGG